MENSVGISKRRAFFQRRSTNLRLTSSRHRTTAMSDWRVPTTDFVEFFVVTMLVDGIGFNFMIVRSNITYNHIKFEGQSEGQSGEEKKIDRFGRIKGNDRGSRSGREEYSASGSIPSGSNGI